jgi:ABC-type glycerol-3-phosphate transport system permease component
MGIPRELEEAAIIDGASRMKIFVRINTAVSSRLSILWLLHISCTLE